MTLGGISQKGPRTPGSMSDQRLGDERGKSSSEGLIEEFVMPALLSPLAPPIEASSAHERDEGATPSKITPSRFSEAAKRWSSIVAKQRKEKETSEREIYLKELEKLRQENQELREDVDALITALHSQPETFAVAEMQSKTYMSQPSQTVGPSASISTSDYSIVWWQQTQALHMLKEDLRVREQQVFNMLAMTSTSPPPPPPDTISQLASIRMKVAEQQDAAEPESIGLISWLKHASLSREQLSNIIIKFAQAETDLRIEIESLREKLSDSQYVEDSFSISSETRHDLDTLRVDIFARRRVRKYWIMWQKRYDCSRRNDRIVTAYQGKKERNLLLRIFLGWRSFTRKQRQLEGLRAVFSNFRRKQVVTRLFWRWRDLCKQPRVGVVEQNGVDLDVRPAFSRLRPSRALFLEKCFEKDANLLQSQRRRAYFMTWRNLLHQRDRRRFGTSYDRNVLSPSGMTIEEDYKYIMHLQQLSSDIGSVELSDFSDESLHSVNPLFISISRQLTYLLRIKQRNLDNAHFKSQLEYSLQEFDGSPRDSFQVLHRRNVLLKENAMQILSSPSEKNRSELEDEVMVYNPENIGATLLSRCWYAWKLQAATRVNRTNAFNHLSKRNDRYRQQELIGRVLQKWALYTKKQRIGEMAAVLQQMDGMLQSHQEMKIQLETLRTNAAVNNNELAKKYSESVGRLRQELELRQMEKEDVRSFLVFRCGKKVAVSAGPGDRVNPPKESMLNANRTDPFKNQKPPESPIRSGGSSFHRSEYHLKEKEEVSNEKPVATQSGTSVSTALSRILRGKDRESLDSLPAPSNLTPSSPLREKITPLPNGEAMSVTPVQMSTSSRGNYLLRHQPLANPKPGLGFLTREELGYLEALRTYRDDMTAFSHTVENGLLDTAINFVQDSANREMIDFEVADACAAHERAVFKYSNSIQTAKLEKKLMQRSPIRKDTSPKPPEMYGLLMSDILSWGGFVHRHLRERKTQSHLSLSLKEKQLFGKLEYWNQREILDESLRKSNSEILKFYASSGSNLTS